MTVTSDDHTGTLLTGLITLTGHTMALEIDSPRGPIPKVAEVEGIDVESRVYGKHEIEEEWVFKHGKLYVGDACSHDRL